jgi:hypothetical protein
VTLDLDDGTSRPAPFHRDDGALEIDLGGIPVERVRRIVVDWPSSRLGQMTLVDTPGLDSVHREISDRTLALLAPPTTPCAG